MGLKMSKLRDVIYGEPLNSFNVIKGFVTFSNLPQS